MQRSIPILWVLTVLLLGGVVVGLFCRSAQSQSPLPADSQLGRYQISSAGPNLYMADTQTGRVWYYDPYAHTWQEQSPVWAKKR
jgi:hypothetical protein